MKRFTLLFILFFCINETFAQTKTAYCDIYLRGSAKSLKIDVAYGNEAHRMKFTNTAAVLSFMAEDGWTIAEQVMISKANLIFTRHKFHLIMEKKYNVGEDPYKKIKSVFYNKKTGRTKVAASTEPVVQEPIYKVGDIIDYKGNKATVIKVSNKDITLAIAKVEATTWVDAMRFCMELGSQWRLPNRANIALLKKQHFITSGINCWISEERIYYSSVAENFLYGSAKVKCSTLAIGIISKSSLK